MSDEGQEENGNGASALPSKYYIDLAIVAGISLLILTIFFWQREWAVDSIRQMMDWLAEVDNLVAAIVVFVLLFLVYVSFLPGHELHKIYDPAGDYDKKLNYYKAKEDVRKNILQLLSGLVIIGIISSAHVAVQNLKLSQEKLEEEKFFKAIELMGRVHDGKRAIDTRVGAIKLLSNWAEDKKNDRQAADDVTDIFLAYITANSYSADMLLGNDGKEYGLDKFREERRNRQDFRRLDPDLQAAMEALWRKTKQVDAAGVQAEPKGTGGPGEAQAYNANNGSNEMKSLRDAKLANGYFDAWNISDIVLSDVDFSLSFFSGTKISNSILYNSKFYSAYLRDVSFLENAMGWARFDHALLDDVDIQLPNLAREKQLEKDERITFAGASMKDVKFHCYDRITAGQGGESGGDQDSYIKDSCLGFVDLAGAILVASHTPTKKADEFMKGLKDKKAFLCPADKYEQGTEPARIIATTEQIASKDKRFYLIDTLNGHDLSGGQYSFELKPEGKDECGKEDVIIFDISRSLYDKETSLTISQGAGCKIVPVLKYDKEVTSSIFGGTDKKGEPGNAEIRTDSMLCLQ